MYPGTREGLRREVCSDEGGSEEGCIQGQWREWRGIYAGVEEGCIQGQWREWRGIYAGVEEGVRRDVCRDRGESEEGCIQG